MCNTFVVPPPSTRRIWFLRGLIAFGALELGLGVAVRRRAFAGAPAAGLAIMVSVVALGWALFIIGPMWVSRTSRRAETGGGRAFPRGRPDATGATAESAATGAAYPGRQWVEGAWPWGAALTCGAVGCMTALLAVLHDVPAAAALAAGGLAALFAWLGVWSWRRLGLTRARSADAATVYEYGVRWFGVLAWAIGTLWRSIEAVRATGAGLVSLEFAFNVVWRALVYFPLCIWGGYVWARAMVALGLLRRPE